MLLWHLTFSSEERDPLFPNEAVRRRAVCALGRVAGSELVLFCVVDDHVHVVVLCGRARCGRLAAGLHRALSRLTPVPMAPAHRRQVDGRSHMQWLVTYILSQSQKHGLAVHPALWSGSCFVDLLGARVVPGLSLRLTDALPRFRLRSVFEVLGLPVQPIAPATDELVRAGGAARLVAAASSALAVGPVLPGKAPRIVAARRIVCKLGRAAGIPASEIAWALGTSTRTTRRHAAAPSAQGLATAVRIRIGLEHVAQLPSLPGHQQTRPNSTPATSTHRPR